MPHDMSESDDMLYPTVEKFPCETMCDGLWNMSYDMPHGHDMLHDPSNKSSHGNSSKISRQMSNKVLHVDTTPESKSDLSSSIKF